MSEEVKIGSMTLEWRGPEFLENVKYAAVAGLNGAANKLSEKMKQNTGVQGPPRSSPGGFPHMDTTTLNKAITTQDASPSRLVAYAGVAKAEGYNAAVADYAHLGATGSAQWKNILADDVAIWLEFGTSKMAARPWCIRSMMESRNTMYGAFMAEAVIAFNSRSAGTPKGVPTRGVS